MNLSYLDPSYEPRQQQQQFQSTLSSMNDNAGRDAIVEQYCRSVGCPLKKDNGQRRCGGPPSNWVDHPPEEGCEIILGLLPPNCYENEIIKFITQENVKLYELRLMTEANQLSKCYAFATLSTKKQADLVVEKLHGKQIRENCTVTVLHIHDTKRLFIGGIPKLKNSNDIYLEMKKHTEGVVKAIVYPLMDDRKKNRGFAFVEYATHRQAALGRKKLQEKPFTLWTNEVAVDWAEPENKVDPETMKKVRNIYIRNLMPNTSNELIQSTIQNVLGKTDCIERVRVLRDYAFVHFKEREDACKAIEYLNNKMIGNSVVEIELAKPVEKNEQVLTTIRESKALAKQDQQLRQMAQQGRYSFRNVAFDDILPLAPKTDYSLLSSNENLLLKLANTQGILPQTFINDNGTNNSVIRRNYLATSRLQSMPYPMTQPRTNHPMRSSTIPELIDLSNNASPSNLDQIISYLSKSLTNHNKCTCCAALELYCQQKLLITPKYDLQPLDGENNTKVYHCTVTLCGKVYGYTVNPVPMAQDAKEIAAFFTLKMFGVNLQLLQIPDFSATLLPLSSNYDPTARKIPHNYYTDENRNLIDYSLPIKFNEFGDRRFMSQSTYSSNIGPQFGNLLNLSSTTPDNSLNTINHLGGSLSYGNGTDMNGRQVTMELLKMLQPNLNYSNNHYMSDPTTLYNPNIVTTSGTLNNGLNIMNQLNQNVQNLPNTTNLSSGESSCNNISNNNNNNNTKNETVDYLKMPNDINNIMNNSTHQIHANQNNNNNASLNGNVNVTINSNNSNSNLLLGNYLTKLPPDNVQSNTTIN
ncbi:hypothetical protein SNEBB_006834 [Seison nebaliae]|nr:hypothetical protein SNEBB_006834 [Seison nebaliae]